VEFRVFCLFSFGCSELRLLATITSPGRIPSYHNVSNLSFIILLILVTSSTIYSNVTVYTRTTSAITDSLIHHLAINILILVHIGTIIAVMAVLNCKLGSWGRDQNERLQLGRIHECTRVCSTELYDCVCIGSGRERAGMCCSAVGGV